MTCTHRVKAVSAGVVLGSGLVEASDCHFGDFSTVREAGHSVVATGSDETGVFASTVVCCIAVCSAAAVQTVEPATRYIARHVTTPISYHRSSAADCAVSLRKRYTEVTVIGTGRESAGSIT